MRKLDIYKQAADRLNKKGIKPFSAREWNVPNIQSVVYGKIKNQKVLDEIQLIKEEYELEPTNL
jgi:hypothetical protein